MEPWRIRKLGVTFDAEELYRPGSHYFCMEVHHGGRFEGFPGRQYIDGDVDYVDLVCTEEFNLEQMGVMVREIGYVYGKQFFHFKKPGDDLDSGLVALRCIDDVQQLVSYAVDNKCIEVFVEHGTTYIDMSEVTLDKVGGEHGVGSSLSKVPKKITPKKKKKAPVFRKKYILRARKGKVIESSPENPIVITYSSGTNEEESNVHEHYDEAHSNYVHDAERMNDGRSEKDYEIPQVDEEHDADDDDYEIPPVDEEHEIHEQEIDLDLFHDFIDAEVEWCPQKPDRESDAQEDGDDECTKPLDLEELESMSEDSDGNKYVKRKKKVPIHDPLFQSDRKVTMKPAFVVGQKFGTKKEILKAVHQTAIDSRRELKVVKNDLERVRAKCHGNNTEIENPVTKKKKVIVNCPWDLLVSPVAREATWQVKTFKDEHNCLQSRKLWQCNSTYLAKKYAEQIRINPDVPLLSIQSQVQEQFEVDCSKMKAFRTKRKANAIVVGTYDEQYNWLNDYCAEVRRTNPGTTILVQCEPCPNPSDLTRKFMRFYCCLGALKEGFKEGCRPILGLDGAFLKGPYPGQLLSAVGVDSNNGLYPLAYAIVEAENMKSWIWFLELLRDDLNLTERSNFTFITDRQKGLIQALAKVMPAAEHRFCLYHIWDNFKKDYNGQAYKDLLWRAATAPTVPYFEKVMSELEKFDKNAYDWLKKIPPKHWSRSHFSCHPKCDMLYNNQCESFNSHIKHTRDKPILSCLQGVKEYLIKRIVNVQTVISKSNGPICPEIQVILNSNKKAASSYKPLWNGGTKYKLSGPEGDHCVVDLVERTCTCRKWDLTGVSCKHAIAAIYCHGQNKGCGIPEAWVDSSYKIETWAAIYQHTICPIPGRTSWPHLQGQSKLLPPTYHAPLGRPRKVRRKSRVDEPVKEQGTKKSKKGTIIMCDKCGKPGHNRRTCKGQGGPNVRAHGSKKSRNSGNGRAAKSVPTQTSVPAAANVDPTQTSAFQAMRKKHEAENAIRRPLFVNGVMFSSQPSGEGSSKTPHISNTQP